MWSHGHATNSSVFAQQLPVARRREDPDSEPEPEGYQPPPQVNSIQIKYPQNQPKARLMTKPLDRLNILMLYLVLPLLSQPVLGML